MELFFSWISVCGARVPYSGWVVNSWTSSSASSSLVLVFGEVQAGDLEGVEEQACSSWGRGRWRLCSGGSCRWQDWMAERSSGRGRWNSVEAGGGAAAFFLDFGGDGSAGGVVEVAEVLLAEAGAGAAASVGEDVAALEARLLVVGCWLLVHGV